MLQLNCLTTLENLKVFKYGNPEQKDLFRKNLPTSDMGMCELIGNYIKMFCGKTTVRLN